MKGIKYVYHPLSIGLVNEILSKDLKECFRETLENINALDRRLVEGFANGEIAMTHLDDILELLYRRSISENIKELIDDVFDREYAEQEKTEFVKLAKILHSGDAVLFKEMMRIRYINLVILTFMPTTTLAISSNTDVVTSVFSLFKMYDTIYMIDVNPFIGFNFNVKSIR